MTACNGIFDNVLKRVIYKAALFILHKPVQYENMGCQKQLYIHTFYTLLTLLSYHPGYMTGDKVSFS